MKSWLTRQRRTSSQTSFTFMSPPGTQINKGHHHQGLTGHATSLGDHRKQCHERAEGFQALHTSSIWWHGAVSYTPLTTGGELGVQDLELHGDAGVVALVFKGSRDRSQGFGGEVGKWRVGELKG